VSFKREKTTFNNKLIALDTINKKILKCEVYNEDRNTRNGFHFDIEGKKT
jgi:hypothetical protein